MRSGLAERAPRRFKVEGYGRAAVLVPWLVGPRGDFRVVLTVRSAHLQHHPGQVSFPGGRQEPEDATTLETALREAHEEIGLEPSRVLVLGRLDDQISRPSRSVVTPYVGVVEGDLELRPDDAGEVAHPFAVDPAAWLRGEGYTRREAVDGGFPWTDHRFLHGEHLVWGLTGRVLRQFLDLLGEP
ncbi:MAG: CoA pyrophosphatase [Planctomycetota bacterium]